MKETRRLGLGRGIRMAVLVFAAGILAAQTAALRRARTLYQQTDYRGALQVLATKDDPSPEAMELEGRCHYMTGDFKKATEDLERAARANPQQSEVYLWLGRAWG